MAAGLARPEPARHPRLDGLRRGSPWRDLPKRDRDWILFTEETPTVPVYAGLTPAETRRALKRKDEPSYQGTFTGARRYVLHTFANTQSPLIKRRVSRYLVSCGLPDLRRKRLQPQSLAVKFARLRHQRRCRPCR